MNEGRFVFVPRIWADADDEQSSYAGVWGLLSGNNCFFPLYSRSKKVIGFFERDGTSSLFDKELEMVEDATDENTPDHVWKKLAWYRLDPEGFAKEFNKDGR